jgi:hypothetical protein
VTALVVIAVAFVLIATAATIRRYADKVIDEVLAVELRAIDRERKAKQYDANLNARWQG